MFKINNLYRSFFFILLINFLIGCAGGGGGGNGGGDGGSTNSSNVATTCTTSTSSYCTSELNNQYGLVTTKAYAAYDRGYNGDGTKVAVLDGGFDTSHSDLDGNIITGYDDEDDNNTPNADSHNTTMGGHGTHVAGIIAAEKNNSGMHGIAYNAKIMPIKVFKDNGTFVSGGINNSIDYATDNGAIALNNSWGSSAVTYASCGGLSCYAYRPAESTSGGFTPAERTAWAGVASDNNVVVFAAGNDGNNSETGKMSFYYTYSGVKYGEFSTPGLVNSGILNYSNRSSQEAQYGVNASAVAENWINVVAVDNTNTITSFSNGCGNTKSYCIAAPGKNINSTLPTSLDADGFGTASGTSMAAPHVAAAIAILKDEYPNLTGAQIVDLLLNNATDLGESGIDEVYGVGLLNLDAATKPSGLMSFAISDTNNNLTKNDIGNSQINFSNLFSKSSIKEKNFLGVVDGYNRVYSLKLDDHTNFLAKKKNLQKKLLSKTHETNISKAKINFNTSLETINHSNEEFFSYNSFEFNNTTNPYHNFVASDYNKLKLHNESTNTNLVITPNYAQDNLNYLISYQHEFNQNNKLNIGYLNEESKFLGSYGVGIFENKSNTKTYFLDYEGKHNFGDFNLLSDFSIGSTELDFTNSDFIKNTRIISSEYSLGVNKNFKNIKLKSVIGITQPLSIIDGNLNIHTVSGYGSTGKYVNRSQEIDLKNQNNYLYFNNYKFFNNNSFIGLDLKASDNYYDFFASYTFKF